mmetsp:Transcript_31210/g.85599  ORF Transcript_31210/g.85599 Transcript_31210/m.85599 type:complete len:684 (+) Transcript_31210:57-2108(+)
MCLLLMRIFAQDVTPATKVKRILSPWTLRFFRSDFESFYLEHHWRHMSYWLWCSVLCGFFYMALLVVFGDDLIAQAFDVRMDHYTKTSLLTESPPWADEYARTVNSTQEADMWRSVRVIEIGNQHRIYIPRVGFLAWHLLWCTLFLAILLIDRFKHRCRCNHVWIYTRTWIAFSVMFLDLMITSFLNPSVTRFMVFVYALLMQVQFIQTVVLVTLSSIALLSAGYIGSHEFLNSITIAEFLILNVVCLSAARQSEMHARLSLYRLWYIMSKRDIENDAKSGKGTKNCSDRESAKTIARKLLSIEEILLDAIPEDRTLDDIVFDQDDIVGVYSSPPGTPVSYAMSIGSAQEATILPLPAYSRKLERGVGPNAFKDSVGSPRNLQASASYAGAGRGPEFDYFSDAGSICSDAAQGVAPLPPWCCLEALSGSAQSMANASRRDYWRSILEPSHFTLRGASYLDDKKKVTSPLSAFYVHQAHIFQTQKPLLNVAARLPSLRCFIASHPQHSFFIYNRCIPYLNDTVLNAVTLLARRIPKGEDPRFDQLFGNFCESGDAYRNARLKHLCRFEKAPQIVLNAIWMLGGEKPVIIGNGYMDQRHHIGKNYVEVDVDISTSWMARKVVGKVLHHGAKVVMDEMIVIEGQEARELPERPIAAWRWINVDCAKTLIPLDMASIESSPAAADAV